MGIARSCGQLTQDKHASRPWHPKADALQLVALYDLPNPIGRGTPLSDATCCELVTHQTSTNGSSDKITTIQSGRMKDSRGRLTRRDPLPRGLKLAFLFFRCDTDELRNFHLPNLGHSRRLPGRGRESGKQVSLL